MGELKTIPVADLLIYEHNPRLSRVDQGQRVSLHDLAEHEGVKLLALADDIAQNGLNPIELPIATPAPNDPGRYIVFEGNRRLCALQILESPDILGTAIGPALLKRFRSASALYQTHPVSEILCYVVLDMAEAEHWIILRHTGENGGAGISPWGTLEQSRFDGTPAPYRELLERLVTDRYVPESVIRKLYVTNFQRIVNTAGVRKMLGFEFADGRVQYVTAWPTIAKTLVTIVNHLYKREVTVNHLRSAQDRVNYVRSLLPVAKKANGRSDSQAATDARSSQSNGTTKDTGKSKDSKTSSPRLTMIPDSCRLRIRPSRIKAIEAELRSIAVERFPNAVGIVFRVFLELSTDSYIRIHRLTVADKGKLAQKLSTVITELVNAGHLSQQQARAVRSAIQSGTYLATSVTTMNDYVHNPDFSPSPSDLRASWDRLEPLFLALWPA